MQVQTRRDLFICAFVRSLEPSSRLVLSGECPAAGIDNGSLTGSKEEAPTLQVAGKSTSGCTVCPLAAFGHDLSSFRAHYQTGWHQFNLQARQRGKPTVTKEEHEELGQFGGAVLESESEDELDQPLLPEKEELGSPFVEFSVQNVTTGSSQAFFIYKRILFATSKVPSGPERLICSAEMRERLVEVANSTVVILLIRSGRIAGAVYEHDTTNGVGRIVQSKVFKRYTTRRGQGGSQLSKDAATGGRIRSAGASLRRSNEAHLQEDMSGLIHEWKSHFARAAFIFWNPTRSGQYYLSNGGEVPIYKDPRCQSIPFTTYVPSIEEVQRCYVNIFSLYRRKDK